MHSYLRLLLNSYQNATRRKKRLRTPQSAPSTFRILLTNKNKNGRNAEDLVIKVPIGTTIKDEETGVNACSTWDCEYEEEEVENDNN